VEFDTLVGITGAIFLTAAVFFVFIYESNGNDYIVYKDETLTCYFDYVNDKIDSKMDYYCLNNTELITCEYDAGRDSRPQEACFN
jgi:hypothetical protein